ncbi:transcriptional regulator [Halobacteriales archaeon QH_7_66_36]|nr:MAG: transcriptional regulator [Halobacteriales archaeon QH_7_66_36]
MSNEGADAGYISSSKHRTAVVRRLYDSPAIPKTLKEDTNRQYSRVSEALSDLRDEGIVELLSPEDRKKGRLYALTKRGEEAWEFMLRNDIAD